MNVAVRKMKAARVVMKNDKFGTFPFGTTVHRGVRMHIYNVEASSLSTNGFLSLKQSSAA